MDPQLLQHVPTWRALLGPNWEAGTVWQAHEAMFSIFPTLPGPLAKQLRYTLNKLIYTNKREYQDVASAHPGLGELGVWREFLLSGKRIHGAGTERGALLSRLFETLPPEPKIEPPSTNAEDFPTLAELLGPDWQDRTYLEAREALRAWARLVPTARSRQTPARVMAAVRRHLDHGTYDNMELLGDIRQYFINFDPYLRNVGQIGLRILHRLLEIPLATATPEPPPPVLPLTVERATACAVELCQRLSPEQLGLWLDLGQKMVAHTQEQEL